MNQQPEQDVEANEQCVNPSGMQLSHFMPTQVDSQGISTAALSLQPQVDTHMQLPTFNNYDYSKLYQASAILNEHDFAARAEATRIMAQDEKYSHFQYGEADYFVQWQKIVREEYQRLEREEGPARHSYDGATGLPIISLYQNEIYNQNRNSKRRHSLALPLNKLQTEAPQVRRRKEEIRRLSLSQLQLMQTAEQLQQQNDDIPQT